MLDPYVLLIFKGIQQRGLPRREAPRSCRGVLDPYVLLTFKKNSAERGPCQPRREGPRSCWGCWILTSSLLLKELSREGALPAQERSSQKLLRVLDPYVLLTFKGIQQRGALPAQERSSQKLRGVLDPSVFFLRNSAERSRASPGERLPEAAGVLDPYVLLTFKRLPEVAGGAGCLRPLYF